ncbi:MAG TPA: L-serine ammonia-lyase, iron-sulfur-dependent, subunit alpha [Bacteroidetes bacterium]|nr:L-serine ammonia-lyase, iron-sulfur-dependent, subunit alpha [Bacteroidota bacterium]
MSTKYEIKYKSFNDIKSNMNKYNLSPIEIILIDESKRSKLPEHKIIEKFEHILEVMKDSINQKAKDDRFHVSVDMAEKYSNRTKSFFSPLVQDIILSALSTSVNNACMHRIVSAPTGGASGVMPGVLVPIIKFYKFDDDIAIKALLIGAAIGNVIKNLATLSGAEGGCQAEIGSASAMTAGAVAYLFQGDITTVESASSIALKNMLGLTCDPVAGLVEIPCIKRNAMGALNALLAVDLSLSGIKTTIPLDEVILAMKDIGDKMDSTLKETGLGGLAATETGKKLLKNLEKSHNR